MEFFLLKLQFFRVGMDLVVLGFQFFVRDLKFLIQQLKTFCKVMAFLLGPLSYRNIPVAAPTPDNNSLIVKQRPAAVIYPFYRPIPGNDPEIKAV